MMKDKKQAAVRKIIEKFFIDIEFDTHTREREDVSRKISASLSSRTQKENVNKP